MARSVPSSSKPALEGGTPTRTEFLVFGKPRIGEEEIQEVAAALRSGWIGTGPRVQTFEEGIGVGVHYIAVPLHPYYRDRFGLREGMFPNAEYVSARTLSVPLTPYLDDQDVEDVITAVTKVLLYYSC